MVDDEYSRRNAEEILEDLEGYLQDAHSKLLAGGYVVIKHRRLLAELSSMRERLGRWRDQIYYQAEDSLID